MAPSDVRVVDHIHDPVFLLNAENLATLKTSRGAVPIEQQAGLGFSRLENDTAHDKERVEPFGKLEIIAEKTVGGPQAVEVAPQVPEGDEVVDEPVGGRLPSMALVDDFLDPTGLVQVLTLDVQAIYAGGEVLDRRAVLYFRDAVGEIPADFRALIQAKRLVHLPRDPPQPLIDFRFNVKAIKFATVT